ncbi:MAG: response regulator transcription factor [Bacteroidales bacterium]|jgi:DNA-binding LytR/AlgR family response regulator|nr:response regulator transcription factor [Bacteroidales bacterium]
MDNIRMTCIAIDDEPLALKQLEAYINKTPSLDYVAGFSSALQAREFLVSNSVDAIFVDINMPDLNGLDFVRSLPVRPIVVFTTAYSEYALEGYKVDAIDYLLKPFSLEEFQRAAAKAVNQLNLLRKADSPVSGKEDSIYLKADYKVVKVPLSDILYIEGMGEYLKIWTIDRERPLVALHGMKKMEERLKDGPFMRVHKSYIVNLEKIKEFSKGKITVESSNFQIPVGDSYRVAFQSYMDCLLSKRQ